MKQITCIRKYFNCVFIKYWWPGQPLAARLVFIDKIRDLKLILTDATPGNASLHFRSEFKIPYGLQWILATKMHSANRHNTMKPILPNLSGITVIIYLDKNITIIYSDCGQRLYYNPEPMLRFVWPWAIYILRGLIFVGTKPISKRYQAKRFQKVKLHITYYNFE